MHIVDSRTLTQSLTHTHTQPPSNRRRGLLMYPLFNTHTHAHTHTHTHTRTRTHAHCLTHTHIHTHTHTFQNVSKCVSHLYVNVGTLSHIYTWTAHEWDHTSNTGISGLICFLWRGEDSRELPWKSVWNLGDFRENLIQNYGESREGKTCLEFW